jgi:hypothetical protein
MRVKKIYPVFSCFYQQNPQILNVRIEFFNGLVANLTASIITNREIHELKIYDLNKLIHIDFDKSSIHLISHKEKYFIPSLFSENIGHLNIQQLPTYNTDNQLKKELRFFAASILNKSQTNHPFDILINSYSIKENIFKLYHS